VRTVQRGGRQVEREAMAIVKMVSEPFGPNLQMVKW